MSDYKIALGILIGLFFISIVIFFCVVLVRLYFSKIKNYTAVIYQKDIDFQKSLNTAIIETQEQVLNDISQDLHDDAGQQLTFINFQLENLKLDSPEWKRVLEPLSESVGNLSASIRSISHSLNNQLLTQQDLLKAIESEVTRLQKNSSIRVEFTELDHSTKVFSTNEKIVIYRIFQEIINNSLKHAKPSVIAVSIRQNPFEMQIADNGRGFNIKDAQGKLSLGLQGMQQRAAIIDYALAIETTNGNGTSITLSQFQTE